jgi:hypothetical protein
MEHHSRKFLTGPRTGPRTGPYTGQNTRENRHTTTNPGDDSTFFESNDLEILENIHTISNNILNINDFNFVLLIIFITYLFNKK